MDNNKIVEMFEDIADLLEVKGETVFVIRAYRNAARAIDKYPKQLSNMLLEGQDFRIIPGIGEAISDKALELVSTGRLQYYDSLIAEFPSGILEIMQISGIGPKTTKRLWNELNVTSLSKLEESLDNGTFISLSGMGKKTSDNIRLQLQFQRDIADSIPLHVARPLAGMMVDFLKANCSVAENIMWVGGIRRFEESVKEIKLICTSSNPESVVTVFLSMPEIRDAISTDTHEVSAYMDQGIKVSLQIVDEAYIGSYLQYFTGSTQHNIQLRNHAASLGFTLNEQGLTRMDSGEYESVTNEYDLYTSLGLQYIPPELRQGSGEILASMGNSIPNLVRIADLKGDLHDHTNWSDGRDSMEDMVHAAFQKNFQYLAITDHSSGRGIANGLSVDRLAKHVKKINDLDKKYPSMMVLSGTEMDIRSDGSLDYSDDVIESVDWVIASIHSAMGQDSKTMTERIQRAMNNPNVDVLGHLSTRLLGTRKPIEADFEFLFKAAADTGTALEINASPERLDLKDSHIKLARELGVPLVISSDAHSTEGIENLEFGVGIARRGWCEARHIVNSLPRNLFLQYLKTDKSERTRFFAGLV